MIGENITMKLKKYLSLAILTLALLLAGCSSDTKPEGGNNGTGTPSVTAAADVSQTPTATPVPPTATPLPTATPAPTSTPTPSPSPIPSIYDRLTETDDEKVYLYDLSERYCEALSGQYVDGRMLMNYCLEDEETQLLESIDLVTGETVTLKEGNYYYSSNIERLNNGTLADFDSTNEIIKILKADGTEIAEFEYPFIAYEDSYIFSNSGEFIYYIHESDGILYRYEIATGTKTPVTTDAFKDSGYISSIDSEDRTMVAYFYPMYDDYYFCYIDLSNGKVTRGKDIPEQEYRTCSPNGNEYITENENLPCFEYYINDSLQSTIRLSQPDEKYNYEVDWKNGLLITISYTYTNTSYTTFTCYNIKTGEPVSNWNVPNTDYLAYSGYSFDPANGFIYFTSLVEKKPVLYVWSYSEDNISDYQYARMDVIPEYLDRQRRELEEKYNMYFYVGHEIASTDGDYIIKTSTNYHQMSDTLKSIDKALSTYPEGFFEQFKTGYIKTLGIYLCDGFIKQAEYQIDDAIALAGVQGYERYLFLDVNWANSIEQNIYHEVSHWIDHMINDQATFGRFEDFENEWMALNPRRFNYEMDYNTVSPFSRYTIYSAKDKADAYFTDDYALTYPTEDRARIFEHLMVYSTDEFMASPHLREKAHFYFDYIRQAFDTTDWPAETEWEKKLRQLDEFYSGEGTITLKEIYPEYFEEQERLQQIDELIGMAGVG